MFDDMMENLKRPNLAEEKQGEIDVDFPYQILVLLDKSAGPFHLVPFPNMLP